MNIEIFLGHVTDVLMSVKLNGKDKGGKLAQLDRGILDVALMISALDGEILPAEVAAYYRLLGKCRGCSKKESAAVLDAALHKAGYLIARKQMGTNDKGCLDAFLREAVQALPAGFAAGSLADLRRAFVFWTTMGLSDGKYSQLERAAVHALADGFAKVRCAAKGKRAKTLPLLEADFLDKVEKLVKDLSVAARRAKAQAALDALINTVEVTDDKGNSSMQPARDITIRAGLIAVLATAGMACSAMADQFLPFGGTIFQATF